MTVTDARAFVRAVAEYEYEHPELAELRRLHSEAEVAFRVFCNSLLPPMPLPQQPPRPSKRRRKTRTWAWEKQGSDIGSWQ